MPSAEMESRLKKIVADRLGCEESAIVPSARFAEELKADSLDLVELIMALEEEFGVEVPEEDLDGIETIGQAYDLVVSKL